MTTTTRWMYRCTDCLAVTAVEGQQLTYTVTDARGRQAGPFYGARCACGGTAKSIGRVVSKRLAYSTKVVPCDARCTNAPGPQCDCSCKGENHGTHRLVTVDVDAGGIPRLSSANVDKGHAWRWTLTALWAAADQRVPMVSYRQGIKVWGSFQACRDMEAWIVDAKTAKTWKGRETKVAEAFAFIERDRAAA